MRNVLEVSQKALPLHSQSRKLLSLREIAEIAQLVEHNLAKVRVASSSLVFRSKEHNYITAEIAQLVEHNLAKVRVASSSLVFRSTMRESMISWFPFFIMSFFYTIVLGVEYNIYICALFIMYKEDENIRYLFLG